MARGYQSSGLMTANSLVKDSSGHLGGLMVIASATNDTVTVTVYDTNGASANTDATVLAKVSLPAAEVSDFKNVPLPDVVFRLGCYAVMSNGNYIVHFS